MKYSFLCLNFTHIKMLKNSVKRAKFNTKINNLLKIYTVNILCFVQSLIGTKKKEKKKRVPNTFSLIHKNPH